MFSWLMAITIMLTIIVFKLDKEPDFRLPRWLVQIICIFQNFGNTLVDQLARSLEDKRGKRKHTRKYHHTRIQRRRNVTYIYAMAAVAMSSQTGANGERTTLFDSDSAPVGIDNRCSACISHRTEDFIGTLTDTNRCIKGFGGAITKAVKKGTLKWSWQAQAKIYGLVKTIALVSRRPVSHLQLTHICVSFTQKNWPLFFFFSKSVASQPGLTSCPHGKGGKQGTRRYNSQ